MRPAPPPAHDRRRFRSSGPLGGLFCATLPGPRNSASVRTRFRGPDEYPGPPRSKRHDHHLQREPTACTVAHWTPGNLCAHEVRWELEKRSMIITASRPTTGSRMLDTHEMSTSIRPPPAPFHEPGDDDQTRFPADGSGTRDEVSPPERHLGDLREQPIGSSPEHGDPDHETQPDERPTSGLQVKHLRPAWWSRPQFIEAYEDQGDTRKTHSNGLILRLSTEGCRALG